MMAAYSSLPSSTISWILDQKRRRNDSICIISLFVVTIIRIDWYVSVYRSFSERYNSPSSVEFKTLQCADIRFISQIIAEMRLLIVIFR